MESKKDYRFRSFTAKTIADLLQMLSLDVCRVIIAYTQWACPTPHARAKATSGQAVCTLTPLHLSTHDIDPVAVGADLVATTVGKQMAMNSIACAPDTSIWLTRGAEVLHFSADFDCLGSLTVEKGTTSTFVAFHKKRSATTRATSMWVFKACSNYVFGLLFTVSEYTLEGKHLRDLDITLDRDGRGEVADVSMDYHNNIWLVHKSGKVTVFDHQGTGVCAFDIDRKQLHGIAISPDRVFMTSSEALRQGTDRIQVFDTSGNKIKELKSQRLVNARGLCMDAAGNLLCCCEHEILWFSNVSTVRGACELVASFYCKSMEGTSDFKPARVCIGSDNRVYVADASAKRVAVFGFEHS